MIGTVYCVLKTGGEYTREHVHALQAMVGRHLEGWEFRCLTDDVQDISDIPLTEGWPGWWSKMELFKQPGPAIFFDLDMIVVGSLDWLADLGRDGEFYMPRDTWGRREIGDRASGLMAWGCDLRYLYDHFALQPEEYMREFRGDQNFIEEFSTSIPIQDVAPGKVVSFKADMRKRGPVPEGVSVVYFHGKPRPWKQDVVPYG